MIERLQKADKFLGTAKICLDNGDYDTCVSRCYYAIFHAAIYALDSIGVSQDRWSHTGVRNTFGKEMVADRNIIPPEISGYIGKAYSIRLIGDYKINAVRKNDAEEVLDMCNKFLKKVKEVFYE